MTDEHTEDDARSADDPVDPLTVGELIALQEAADHTHCLTAQCTRCG